MRWIVAEMQWCEAGGFSVRRWVEREGGRGPGERESASCDGSGKMCVAKDECYCC